MIKIGRERRGEERSGEVGWSTKGNQSSVDVEGDGGGM